MYKNLGFMGMSKYRVGTDGSVWSLGGRWGHSSGWKLLKQTVRKGDGRTIVSLYDGLSCRQYNVHTLVLLAFVGPCPPGMECRHFPDRNPANNCLENLSWGTRSQNQQDRITHGTSNRGMKYNSGEHHGQVKLSWKAVRRLRKYHSSGRYSASKLGLLFNIGRRYVYRIVNMECWCE